MDFPTKFVHISRRFFAGLDRFYTNLCFLGLLSVPISLFQLQFAEQLHQNDHSRNGQHQFGYKLGIGQTIEREEVVEDKQSRDLQDDLAQDGKDQGVAPQTGGLEHTHCQEVHTQERQAQAEATQEPGTHLDDLGVVHEQGDKVAGAAGVPEELLRKAAGMAICKINIDTDIRLAMTASIRKQLVEHPEEFDPRGYLKPARQAVKDMVQHKIKHVLGCSGKA